MKELTKYEQENMYRYAEMLVGTVLERIGDSDLFVDEVITNIEVSEEIKVDKDVLNIMMNTMKSAILHAVKTSMWPFSGDFGVEYRLAATDCGDVIWSAPTEVQQFQMIEIDTGEEDEEVVYLLEGKDDVYEFAEKFYEGCTIWD